MPVIVYLGFAFLQGHSYLLRLCVCMSLGMLVSSSLTASPLFKSHAGPHPIAQATSGHL